MTKLFMTTCIALTLAFTLGCGGGDDSSSSATTGGDSSGSSPAASTEVSYDTLKEKHSEEDLQTMYIDVMSNFQFNAWQARQNAEAEADDKAVYEGKTDVGDYAKKRAATSLEALAKARDTVGITIPEWRALSKHADANDWFTKLDSQITEKIEALKAAAAE